MIAAPPRLPQLLLSALGARAEFRDGVLGDLAEEYYMRAEMQGAHAARAWYVDQAWRAAPHLFADGGRNLGGGGVAHVAMAVVKAYACLAAVAAILFPLMTLLPHGITTFGYATTFVVGPALSLAGGYLAARFGRRAPLLSAAALGVFWATLYTVGLLVVSTRVSRADVPTWYAAAGLVIILVGTAFGGILRVARPRVA